MIGRGCLHTLSPLPEKGPSSQTYRGLTSAVIYFVLELRLGTTCHFVYQILAMTLLSTIDSLGCMYIGLGCSLGL
jgi:hypothetical protein